MYNLYLSTHFFILKMFHLYLFSQPLMKNTYLQCSKTYKSLSLISLNIMQEQMTKDMTSLFNYLSSMKRTTFLFLLKFCFNSHIFIQKNEILCTATMFVSERKKKPLYHHHCSLIGSASHKFTVTTTAVYSWYSLRWCCTYTSQCGKVISTNSHIIRSIFLMQTLKIYSCQEFNQLDRNHKHKVHFNDLRMQL